MTQYWNLIVTELAVFNELFQSIPNTGSFGADWLLTFYFEVMQVSMQKKARWKNYKIKLPHEFKKKKRLQHHILLGQLWLRG